MRRRKRFYVYELRDEQGVVFYVGKGSGRRFTAHEIKARRGEQSHRANTIRKIWGRGGRVEREIVFRSSSEQEAFDEEVRRIALYGRVNLTNKSDGGGGPRNMDAH